jgi:hypothetical protein
MRTDLVRLNFLVSEGRSCDSCRPSVRNLPYNQYCPNARTPLGQELRGLRVTVQLAYPVVDQLTSVWQSLEQGDAQAAEELLPIVYEELRKLAASKMAQEASGQTLQATALVHEAWLRLAGEEHPWDNRRHFFSAAAEAMRRILVDRARAKRGGATHIALEFVVSLWKRPMKNC